MYNHLVGGVLALGKEQFLKVNGWSNLYWGWGVSDQDDRVESDGVSSSRPKTMVSTTRYSR